MLPFMHFKIFTLLALLATTPAFGINLESAVQTALANNRELQAARFAVSKAKGRLAQAGKWPNPELELSGM
ncbi:MAG: TolC family protein, partial [bacterium]